MKTPFIWQTVKMLLTEKIKGRDCRTKRKNTEFLLNQNAKIIVVACNTATTNAIKELRAKYDVPFIGIEPPSSLQLCILKPKKLGSGHQRHHQQRAIQ
jgi:glutamate racemase